MGKTLGLSLKEFIDEERLTLTDRLLSILKNVRFSQDPIILLVITDFSTQSTNLTDAVKRKTASDLTKIKAHADLMRDNALDLIKDAINYNIKRRNNTIKEAAKILKEPYDKAFDGVNIQNNSIETASIKIFLNDLQSEIAQNAITTLGIETEVEELQEGQENYIQAEASRALNKESDETPLLKPARRKLHNTLSFLEKYLEFRIDRGDRIFIDLTGKLLPICTEMMAVAKARATRKENEEDVSEE